MLAYGTVSQVQNMKEIYFPRHQRRFFQMGDVGSHPQFRHLDLPPQGFGFTSTPMGYKQWLKSLPEAFKNAFYSWMAIIRFGSNNGVSLLKSLGFIWSRGLSLVPAPAGMDTTFLPTFPFTHQNEKWFLEIEDVTTLFRPYILNGQTERVKVRELGCYPLVKNLLESDKCLGIMTHVQSTQDSLKKIFTSPVIDAKTKFLPAPYIPTVEVHEADLNQLRSQQSTQFFFNNSWHQDAVNFYLRGGVSILEAFERALDNQLPVRLVLRSKIPKELMDRFGHLLAHPQVEFVNHFLLQEDYLKILQSSHYFLLPSARLHVVSLLESMYLGAVPIVSDGWGISEYVTGGINGFVVPGVYGKVSWVDKDSGELRENYGPMYQQPGLLTEGLYRVIEKTVKPSLHSAMALAGHRLVRDQYSIAKFNPQFSEFLSEGLNL